MRGTILPADEGRIRQAGLRRTGALPVMKEVKREAKHRKIKLLILPTAEAIKELQQKPDETNAILHVTC